MSTGRIWCMVGRRGVVEGNSVVEVNRGGAAEVDL